MIFVSPCFVVQIKLSTLEFGCRTLWITLPVVAICGITSPLLLILICLLTDLLLLIYLPITVMWHPQYQLWLQGIESWISNLWSHFWLLIYNLWQTLIQLFFYLNKGWSFKNVFLLYFTLVDINVIIVPHV